MAIVESKSLLAKLMAVENIDVVHDNSVNIPYFSPQDRKLVCPVWKEMSGDLYDAIMGHEVGHALNTPADGWHTSVTTDPRPNFKTFLNVVEDVRTDRLQRRRYPGLGRSFAEGYKQLHERDYFGVKKLKNIDDLNLVDRINIKYKLGHIIFVRFSKEEETRFLSRLDTIETWEQVVALASEIYDYVQQKEEDKIQNVAELRDFIEDSSDDSDDEEQDEMESEATEDQPSVMTDDEGEFDDAETDDETDENEIASESDFTPTSVTDEVFREMESQLVAGGSKAMVVLHTPKVNLDKIIIPSKKVYDEYRHALKDVNADEIEKESVTGFLKEYRNYIALLVQEFEMRKNASQYTRSLTAKTGELDTRNLAKYKFTNDIFRKVTRVAKGKSHGMVMFLDMSASMRGHRMNYAVQQVLVLASFCKKVNIPFKVYGFTNDSRYYSDILVDDRIGRFDPSDERSMYFGYVRAEDYKLNLVEFLTSEMSVEDYTNAFRMLCLFSESYRYIGKSGYWFDHYGTHLTLQSTPIIPTIVAARKVLKEFQDKHRVDVLNTIFLTDGEGNAEMHFAWSGWNIPTIQIQDEITQDRFQFRERNNYEYTNTHHQSCMFQWLKEVTGTNLYGFFIGEDQDLRNVLRTYKKQGLITDDSTHRKNLTVDQHASVPLAGFDQYYLVVINREKVATKNIPYKNEKTKIYKQFIGEQSSKVNRKILAQKFSQSIAA